jgi:hypothetical protein
MTAVVKGCSTPAHNFRNLNHKQALTGQALNRPRGRKPRESEGDV